MMTKTILIELGTRSMQKIIGVPQYFVNMKTLIADEEIGNWKFVYEESKGIDMNSNEENVSLQFTAKMDFLIKEFDISHIIDKEFINGWDLIKESAKGNYLKFLFKK